MCVQKLDVSSNPKVVVLFASFTVLLIEEKKKFLLPTSFMSAFKSHTRTQKHEFPHAHTHTHRICLFTQTNRHTHTHTDMQKQTHTGHTHTSNKHSSRPKRVHHNTCTLTVTAGQATQVAQRWAS